MNTNDRGQNLAEARHFKAAKAAVRRPVHGGHPDPRCACAGTGYVHEGGTVVACPEHILTARDPRGEAPSVDWETVAGRAMADLQAAANELKRLRREMPVQAIIEYDRRYHGGA